MPIQIKIKSSGADIHEYGPADNSKLCDAEPAKPAEDESTVKDKVTEDKPVGHSEAEPGDKYHGEDKPPAEGGQQSPQDKPQEGGQQPPEEVEGGIKYEYEGEDVFYTDQTTKVRYKWDKDKSCWSTLDGETSVPSAPQPSSEDYEFDGDTYVYKDKKGTKHRWNKESNQWDKKEDSEESEEDDSTTEEERKARQYRKRKAAPGWEAKKYEKDPETGKTIYKDSADGMTYEWDENKKAWFPLIGEDFMAAYQLNYGFTNDLEARPTLPDPVVEKPIPEPQPNKQKKTKKEVEPPTWFDVDEKTSTKVYVSGLPPSVTDKEFEELMGKCGMVEHDLRTKKSKLKLYRDESGVPKGDGLCSYIKPESVQLALTILDGSEFKGSRISVERAKFEMKGEAYDPKLKPKKLNKKEKEKAARHKEKLFAWIPDKMKGERAKHEKVVVIKNLFDPAEFNLDPGLIIDYTSRIRAQCSKFGTITKLTLFDKHEEGLCQIFFKEPAEADMAVQMLNGRLFGKRIMSVETWDGRTKYRKEETKEEEKERLEAWEKYLEGEEAKECRKKEERERKEKDEKEGKEITEGNDVNNDEDAEDDRMDEDNNGNESNSCGETET